MFFGWNASDEVEDDPDLREQIFHDRVRDHIIFFLLFICLYAGSYAIVCRFKRRDRDEYLSGDSEDETVYRTAIWLCTFSLATSLTAAFLLPLSIVSNEILFLYPQNYYVKWLNSDLIHGLWNIVFLMSNACLFVFLPFAYLFTEAEGFYGWKKRGLWAKAYETLVVLFLMAILVFGMTFLISLLLDRDEGSWRKLFNVWSFYLPFLYSCVSFFGVVCLMVCTPLGITRLFSVVGTVLVRPQFLGNAEEEFFAASFERDALERKLRVEKSRQGFGFGISGSDVRMRRGTQFSGCPDSTIPGNSEFELRIKEAAKLADDLDRKRRASRWQRNVGYPLAMLLLLFLTGITALMVINNTLMLLIGMKALPQGSEQLTLGITSLSALGPLGAGLEVVVILYLIVTSIIGLYTLPVLENLRPRKGMTPMTHIISNCAVVVVLSSAIPLLARTVGITDFDLLGNFGKMEWLGNFKVILCYNVFFATATIVCLINHFTAPVRRELILRLEMTRDAFLSSMKITGQWLTSQAGGFSHEMTEDTARERSRTNSGDS